MLAYLQDFYGAEGFDWQNEVSDYRLEAHWMTVYAPDVASLLTS
jgi:hypothetical protein